MPFLRLLKPKTESEPENIVKISEAEDAANNGNISTSESANGTEGISGNCVSDSDSGSGVHDNVLSGDSVRQGAESRAESKPESERESESKSESESESETKPGADSESDSEAEAASESETETESNSETKDSQGEPSSSAQESDSQTDSGTVQEQESESEFNAQGVHEDLSESESYSEREQESESESESTSESESRPEEQTVSELPEGSSDIGTESDLQQHEQDNEDSLNLLTTETPEIPETESKPENDEFKLQYDFTSGQRYVDLVSTKTEFDKMLDELANISKELLEHEAERFAKKYTGKFKAEDGESESEADARKYEAFLGGYISNAALLLYDKGYQNAALKQLEQAKITLETKKRLEEETAAIHSRVEENNDVVDLSDILGLFGDG
ncbi:MAG: hypothetical protein IJP48_00460 [Synergistaceae bacterium]|nr:hypothetical protein [Synergistaceae bacterium]